ncbi:YobA family protein [Pontibacter beigongshangensis]|uniref:YobA family protein n=1 Tax=Pontibacter beigongshangensis TaxID=2574733 RepID=UPI001F50B6AF|nr:YobA family protein [Pontibacter beigongshangensis]
MLLTLTLRSGFRLLEPSLIREPMAPFLDLNFQVLALACSYDDDAILPKSTMKRTTPLLYLLAFLLASCSGDTARRIPDTVPDVQGTITSLKKTAAKNKDNNLAVILVESQEETTSIYARASIKIDSNTHIEDQDGGVLKPEQLREGQLVEAWLEGPVMESDPVQAYATAVRVSL